MLTLEAWKTVAACFLALTEREFWAGRRLDQRGACAFDQGCRNGQKYGFVLRFKVARAWLRSRIEHVKNERPRLDIENRIRVTVGVAAEAVGG